jgi:NADH-quinone oxidoreductase subunit G
MYEVAPQLAQLDVLADADVPQAGAGGKMSADAFAYAVSDFYFTNPIARASATMADCAKAKENRSGQNEGTGTDG